MVSAAVAGGPMVQGELRVCPECGAVAPAERTRCGVCQTTLGPLCPTVPTPTPGRAWTRAEVSLPCPHCNTVIGLRADSIGAPVACHHCGHSVAVELGWWDEALQIVHAAADLSQPDFQGLNAPLGAFNPFAAVGSRESFAEFPSAALPSQSPLRLRVGPGAPLCPRCRNPVTVRFSAPGRLTAHCTRCNDREAFSAPDMLMQRFPALRALLAYPAEAAAAQGRIEPWWILFDGLSYLRPMIQDQKAQAERADAERVAWEAWNKQERERQAAEARQRQELEEHERVERDKRDAERREREARERLEQGVREARAEAARERSERELALAEIARLEGVIQQETERFNRELWERGEQERAARERQTAADQQRFDAMVAERDGREKKLRRRFLVMVGLWVVVALGLAADLAVAWTGP
jgi:hypothetical protein